MAGYQVGVPGDRLELDSGARGLFEKLSHQGILRVPSIDVTLSKIGCKQHPDPAMVFILLSEVLI